MIGQRGSFDEDDKGDNGRFENISRSKFLNKKSTQVVGGKLMNMFVLCI